jgi:arylformamidase
MKTYDVTVRLSNQVVTWPGDPAVSNQLFKSTGRGDPSNVTRLDMGVHTGTHIDAPFHFEPDGAGVDELSLDILMGPCRVLDLTDLKEYADPV